VPRSTWKEVAKEWRISSKSNSKILRNRAQKQTNRKTSRHYRRRNVANSAIKFFVGITLSVNAGVFVFVLLRVNLYVLRMTEIFDIRLLYDIYDLDVNSVYRR